MRGATSAALATLLGWLASRRQTVAAVVLVVFALAGVALTTMPVQLLPEIRYPQIRVIGDLPGQTSRVIEESINEPLEAALDGVPGVVRLESRSGDGRAYLELFFDPGYDIDRALQDVNQAVARGRAHIPREFPDPRVFAVATDEEPAIQLAFGSEAMSAPEIRQRLRASLLPRIRSIEGVEQVFIGREETAELVVGVDPERQVELGVSLPALEQSLVEATEPPPSGTLRAPGFEGIGILDRDGWSVRALSSQPLAADETGTMIDLASVADVARRPSEQSLRTRLDGRSAVLVTVHRSPAAHALDVAEEVSEVVAQTGESEALADIEATTLFDDSVVTQSAVQSVVVAAVGGALLAMILLALTMRLGRRAPLVALIVAASLAAAVLVLGAMGQSLNLLTLAGLLLSVGMGLDYAIIYFDRLDRRGASDERAAIEAMVDVAGPLFGALLTTLAAVLPFLLVRGLVALLFQPLIWTVVVAAAFSFIFALVLLPTFGAVARAQPAGQAADGDDDGEEAAPATDSSADPPSSGGSDEKERRPDEPRRRWRILQHPAGAWSAMAVCAIVLVLGGRALPFEVLPVVDDGFVEVRLIHPAGIPADDMDLIAQRVERELADVRGTESVFTTVGGYFREGLPSFRPATANFMVQVDTDERSSAAWSEAAREAIDALEMTELSARFTLPRIRGVQTRLADDDLIAVLTRDDGDLLALAEIETQIVRALQQVEGLTDVERVRAGVSPRWRAVPDYDRLAELGVEPAELEHVVEYALEGRVLRERMEFGEPLVLRARYDRARAGAPHQLTQLRLLSTAPADARLGDLVEFELVEEPTHIERRDGQRVVRIAAGLDPAGPGPRDTADAAERALADLGLPDGVSWWMEGEIDALEETRRTFSVALTLALVLVLTLLVIQYGTFAYAIAGLFTIPLSAAGSVVLLYVLGRPLDAMVLAGLLIAVGIVANNVILVLSEASRAASGDEPGQHASALRAAGRRRLRPITLTAASTVIGMSPLLVGGAEVFGLLQPLAIALTGALLLSIPIACLALPGIAYTLVAGAHRISTMTARSRRGPKG